MFGTSRFEVLTRFGLTIRAAVGAGLSYAIAALLHFQHPIFALIAAVIVTDFSASETSRLALQRLAGTLVGAVVGASLRSFVEPNALTLGTAVLLGMPVCYLIRAPNGAKLAGYVAAITMLDPGGNPWRYASYRLVETMVGVGVAWTLSLVPRLIRNPNGET